MRRRGALVAISATVAGLALGVPAARFAASASSGLPTQAAS